MEKKLLIIGDSFATSEDATSWTKNLVGFSVDNRSLNGASEYKLIRKMLDIDKSHHDQVIFVHTSPNKIYVESNPFYTNNLDYKHSDLMYKDMESKLPDKYAGQVMWWFENVFNFEHARFMHHLLIDHAVEHLPNALHISFFNLEHPMVTNLHEIWKKNPGEVNHMNKRGNDLTAAFVKNIYESRE